MKTYTILFCGLMMSITAFGQGQLKGKVFDTSNNNALPGATVQVSGKAVTTTDKDGMFSIECKDSSEISVSFISYETYNKMVKNCDEELNVGLTPSKHNLNEVEITATSNANKSILYIPTSIVKLQETELKRGNGLYMDDAINANIPGVFMERRTISAGQQFNIRGYGNGARGTNGINSNFDTQGSKVYLNGIPVTDAEGITLMDDIDFASIGNVEVIKGPAGTLYGLAIAGVVNLQTKKAEKGKVIIGQDIMTGSYGLSRLTTHIQVGGDRSSLLVNYGKQKSAGFVTHTASHKDFVNLIGEFQPNEKQSINTYLGYSNSYDERQGELTIGQYDTLNFTGNPAYINNNAHSEIISFRAGVAHTYTFNKHISNTTSLFGTGISNNVSSAGGWTDKRPVNIGLRSTVDIKYALNEKFNLSGLVGVESQVQYAQTIGYSMVKDSFNMYGYNLIGNLTSNGSTINQTTSAFTEWTLSVPSEISLTVGVGLSTMNIDYWNRVYSTTNNNPSKNKNPVPVHYSAAYDGMISPHIALNKVFSKQFSTYVSYSIGYKAPVSSYIFIPTTNMVNTGLKPELGTQYEIGAKGIMLDGKLNLQVAAFDAIFSNKMTAVAVPNPAKTATLYTYLVNGGSQDDKGLEVLVKYTAYKSSTGFFKSISPFANMAYSDFKYVDFKYQKIGKTKAAKDSAITADYSGNAVAGVAKITVNIGMDIDTKAGIYANVNFMYRDPMPYTSDGLNYAGSYGLLNAKLGFHKTFVKHFDIDIFYGLINITEQKYAYMVFLNQLPDAYMPAPNVMNYFAGANLKYIF
ncbi:MAG: TonB-dependent receptor [Bacteroidia bacterium]|nr:TonB-dependent receptor [Bacteroidia bacterium]